MRRTGTSQPRPAAIFFTRSASSIRKKGGTSACRHAARAISPPMPAGSPMVSARGDMSLNSHIHIGVAVQVAHITARQILQLLALHAVLDVVIGGQAAGRIRLT